MKKALVPTVPRGNVYVDACVPTGDRGNEVKGVVI